MGARVTREDDNGDIDFSLDGIDGFARGRRGKSRASFFFEYDPDPLEFEDWDALHQDVAYAEVQYIAGADSTALQLLVELPFDEREHIWAAAHTVRSVCRLAGQACKRWPTDFN